MIDSWSVKKTTEKMESLDEELRIYDFSHYPLPVKEKGLVRIFYNNVNGLEINAAINVRITNNKGKKRHGILKEKETYTKLEALLKQLQTWDVNITGLTEPCVEWKDVVPRTVVKEMGKKYDRFGHWSVATSSTMTGSYVKPGGALLYNDGETASRMMESGTDPWGYGRWAYKRYTGRQDTSLLVIVGYRVGSRNTNAGPSTAWYQQRVLLAKDKRQLDPPEAFIKDIGIWITTKRTEKTEIIFFLDANEKWDKNSKIKGLADKLNLYNLNLAGDFNFPDSHPSITNPSRNTTIDYCLCTEKALTCVTYATMAPYDLRVLGDHRGFLIDVNMNKLLRIDKQKEGDAYVGRKLVTSNIKATEKYLQIVEEKFEKQNIIRRVDELYGQWKTKKRTKWETKRKYEILDKEIFHICRLAEKKCKRTVCGTYAWSPKLVQAIKHLSYWRARKKYTKENSVVRHLGRETGIDYQWHTTEEIEQFINESRYKLQEVQEEAIENRKSHLNDLAEKYAKENKLQKKQQYKN